MLQERVQQSSLIIAHANPLLKRRPQIKQGPLRGELRNLAAGARSLLLSLFSVCFLFVFIPLTPSTSHTPTRPRPETSIRSNMPSPLASLPALTFPRSPSLYPTSPFLTLPPPLLQPPRSTSHRHSHTLYPHVLRRLRIRRTHRRLWRRWRGRFHAGQWRLSGRGDGFWVSRRGRGRWRQGE